MRNSTRLLTLLTLVIAGLFLFGTAFAGSEDPKREGFLDLDMDGINDNMKDSDEDGIPNAFDDHEGVAQGGGEGSANMGESANAYANSYSEQLQNEYLLKHVLWEERIGEFKGEVPEDVGAWGDSGENNLNPEWTDESGSTQDVGHKGVK